jgi:6-phosphofructokinase 1
LQGGYRGFYSRNTIDLTPKTVNDIHKRGGTVLQTSRGGHDTGKIVDSIQDRDINQVSTLIHYLSSSTFTSTITNI